MKKIISQRHADQIQSLDNMLGINKSTKLLPVCDHYAGSERTIEKSLQLQSTMGPVFDVTLDLEDGGGLGSETANRELVRDALNSADNRYNRVGIRIHGLDTHHWKQDIDAVVGHSGKVPAYITIPKVKSSSNIDEVDAYVRARAKIGGAAAVVPLHVMVEDLLGLKQVDLFAAHENVECISFGMLDFVGSFDGAIPEKAMNGSSKFDHPIIRDAKIKISLACRVNQIVPSHSITLDIRNKEVVYQDAKRAREEFGYMRMWSIHPSQIEPILQGFRFDDQELSEAIDILVQAKAASWAPIRFNESMHDLATYRIYWAKVRTALLQGVELPGQIELLLN